MAAETQNGHQNFKLAAKISKWPPKCKMTVKTPNGRQNDRQNPFKNLFLSQ